MGKLQILKVYFFILLLISFGIYTYQDKFIEFFNTSPIFNIAISIMFLLGLITILGMTFKLILSSEYLNSLKFNFDTLSLNDIKYISLVFPMNVSEIIQKKINSKEKSFTTKEVESIIEWVDEDYNYKKSYLLFTIEISLMIGLLGTFVGLLVSINGLGSIVDLLINMKELDIKMVLSSFGEPLKGMAVGFGSSLFGVAVAIILNLMGYLVNKNYGYFFNELKEFLEVHIEKEEINAALEEQINLNNKELIYLSEIYKLLKNNSELKVVENDKKEK